MAAASKSNPADTDTATVRLHIVPLTADTAASLLPASVLTCTTTISYHTLPTFPEHPYAFVTLPVSAAAALKKKLHGSTFRGVKVSVEEAHPQKPTPDMSDDAAKTKKELRAARREKRKQEEGEGKAKKRKKGETKDVLEGALLPEGRKVARGWAAPETTSTTKKYTGRSSSAVSAAKEDTKRECLFKTPLPPNKVSTKEDKKKDKEEKKEKKERKRNKEVIVKEFKNNTKFPAFLKGSQLGERATGDMVSEYVDGVGWVNGRGEVVEGENRKRRAADVVQMDAEMTTTVTAGASETVPKPTDKYKGTISFEDADEAMADAGSKKTATEKYFSSSGSESEAPEPETESEDDSEIPKTKPTAAMEVTPDSNSESSGRESDGLELEAESKSGDLPTTKKTKPTLSSDLESSDEGSELDSESELSSKHSTKITTSDEEEEGESDSEPEPPTKTKPSQTTPTTPISLPIRTVIPSPKTSTPTLQITIPISSSPKIHPLEALYKPTATTLSASAAASSTSSGFKFGFGANDDDDDDEDDPEASPIAATPYRERYRSAAPTPDTAIGHRKFFPDESDPGSRLAFVPSTPRVAGQERGVMAESPLLFLHPESRFLGALSVWNGLPTPKAFVPNEPVAEEEEVAVGKKDKGKKGKRVAEEMEEDKVELTPAGVWSERFYEKRGEWNRAWKGRRREVLKAKRKRAAAGRGGRGGHT